LVILKAILCDLESPEYWLNKGRLIFEEHLGGEVGGDHKSLMLEIEISSLSLSCAGVFICPDLKIVPDYRCIQVFDNYNFLT